MSWRSAPISHRPGSTAPSPGSRWTTPVARWGTSTAASGWRGPRRGPGSSGRVPGSDWGTSRGPGSTARKGSGASLATPAGFVARGLARLPGDTSGALADFDAALAIDPAYPHALQDKASVLSEYLGKTEPAVEVLDVALRHHPESVEALAGRGVLLARLGRREAALRDARAALKLDDRPLTLYQAACVYALTSKLEPADLGDALRLMSEATRKDGSWAAIARQDRDLDPIRGRPGFQELVGALDVVLKAGLGR